MQNEPNPVNRGDLIGAHQNGAPLTMSSREIAELLEKRHDKVKQSIDRLVERGVIVQPPVGDEQDVDTMGRSRTTSVYQLQKRDTYVVVAQLSPEFTARLVDRWQELEASAVLTGPQLMAAALIEADATMRAQAEQIETMKPKVEAFDRIAYSDGSLCVTDAAKDLQVRPKDLFDYLSQSGWIYRRQGNKNWLGYQSKVQQGLLEHKVTQTILPNGDERIDTQVRITPKGLGRISMLLNPGLRGAA